MNSHLRIVQAVSSLGEGGMELVPLMLAPGLREKGQQVSVWADPDSFLGRKAVEGGLSPGPFHFSGHFHPLGIWRFRQALRKDPPDLIHLHHSRDLSTVVPALALEGWKGPLVLSKHVASSILKKDFLHRWLYRRVDLLLACSDFIRRNVIETCPVDPEKVRTAFAPVDTRRFHADPEARKRHRKAWGWEGQEVIGMVARITPGKGHELFLRAASKLLAKRPRARFRIAGNYSPDEAWFHDRLMALRSKLGLEKAVVYEGRVQDVPGFLSGLDVAVHMARAESFGMAVAEALACGRPVVARRGGGVAEILERGPGEARGGIVLDTDNPGEWARVLARVLKSKALTARFRRESRPMALRFSLGPWVNLHLQWYRQLLEAKRQPTG